MNRMRTPLHTVRAAAASTILLAVAAVVLMPYLWMVLTSLKTSQEVFTPTMRLFPRSLHVQNYWEVFRTGSFGRYVVNSGVVTASGMVLEAVIVFLGGYAFARLRFYGERILFYLLLGTLMIPPQVLMLPTYLVVGDLGWLNTYAGLIVPRAGAAFGIFMLRQFIRGIPKELDAAAEIDGARLRHKLLRLYLPLAGPALMSFALFSAIAFWNDYFWPLIVVSRDEMRTLSLGIGHFKNLEGMGQWELLMAAGVVATLPMIGVFLAFRGTIMSNFTVSGVKG